MSKKILSFFLVLVILNLQVLLADGATIVNKSTESSNLLSITRKISQNESVKTIGSFLLTTVSLASAKPEADRYGVSVMINSCGASEEDVKLTHKAPFNLKSGNYKLSVNINSGVNRKACIFISKNDKSKENIMIKEVNLKKGENKLSIPFYMKDTLGVLLSFNLGKFQTENLKSHKVKISSINILRTGNYSDPSVPKEDPDRFKNRIVNGDFSDSKKKDNGWWTNGDIKLDAESGTGILTVPGGSVNAWDAMTGNFINYKLYKNRTYSASFEISSEIDQSIVFQIVDSEEKQIVAKSFKIGSELKKYTLEFDNTEDCLAKTAFQLGGKGTKGQNYTVKLDNLQVYEVEGDNNSGPVDPYSNMVKNSDFTKDTKNWNVAPMEGGDGSFSVEKEEGVVNIANTGTKEYSIQFFQDGLKLYKGNKYRLSFRYKANTPRKGEIRIQQNGGTYQGYLADKSLSFTDSWQTYDKEFTMNAKDDTAARLCFNLGVIGSPTTVNQSIYFDDFKLIMTKGVIPEKKKPSMIYLNQVGYRLKDEKIAFVPTNGRTFKLYSLDNMLLLTGNLTPKDVDSKGKPIVDPQSGDIIKQADFSKLMLAGKFYLKVGSDKSPVFEIGDNVYNDMTKAVLKLFYYQTCGGSGISKEYAGSVFAHKPCHTEKAKYFDETDKVYGSVNIDVSGGWHDAGDYGRYVTPAAKTVADLLNTLEFFPKIANMNYGSPNKLLAEVKYEIQWLLKMQNSITGGVYHKVTTKNHAAMTVLPEQDKNQLYLSPVSAQATADFSAVMALASRLYKNTDKAFSTKCLKSAEKAWNWLLKNPGVNSYEDPYFFTTGTYADNNSGDERFWASCELYRATGKAAYLSYIVKNNQSYTGFGWANMGYYAMLSYLNCEFVKKNDATYNSMKETVLINAGNLLSSWKKDGYKTILDEYVWGSNMEICDGAMLMIMADRLKPNPNYKKALLDQLDYLLGRNTNGTSYVTGYGTNSAKHPHHRQSIIKDTPVPGMLVGGPNGSIIKVDGDPVAKMVTLETPPAKCYADVDGSFATNEICIYWNSPLAFILGYLYEK